jgi:acetyl-CoA acyltransferase
MSRPPDFHEDLGRAVIVRGLRTPFAKQGSSLRRLSAIDLATAVIRELVERLELAPNEVDAIVYGQVIPTIDGPNVAREALLQAGLPRSIDAFSVTRACATSTQAVAVGAQMIATGQAKIVVAGGVDSTSDVPITVSKPLAEALVTASKARTPMDKLRAFAGLGAKDLLPVPPAIKERAIGLSMGEAAEKMAKENGITREAQDAFAHRSHTRASAAWRAGTLAREVMAVYPPRGEPAVEDNLIRHDSEVAKYAALKPAFDKKWGTITAGNASPLTDGASAVVLMRDDVAKALGHAALARVKSFAFVGIDPAEQLLQGPAYAAPRALEAARIKLSDLSLVDMHEAFAAQMLSNLQALASRRFAEEKLGRSEAVGEVPDEKLNIYGGSIALGHPFAATGTRQIATMANELARRGGGLALITQCAAGGLGAAMVLEG